ncbi:MAG: SusC/RagA family TonB-linked outer membrane protein, partial [Saprospiraceae bacterium]
MKLSTLKHNCLSAALVLFALLWSSSVFTQTITISGTVTAADSGEPLIGANILVQNTAIGTTTEVDGTYSLQVPNANAVLEVTYVGYKTQTVNVAGRTTVDIAMEPDAGLLEEVVVIGYGTQRKGDLTGSIATVEGSELSKIPTASLQQALQGKVPGVQVVTTSGRPGEGAVVRIRGVGTLNNADPLYVIDGVIMPENVDINSLVSPNDIENLSVLKDASAAAIYGARGANGVILITTKKGATGDRSVVSFSTFQSSQEIVKTIPLANAREYAILANQVARNEIGPNAPLPFPDPNALGEGTDWQKEVYQTAPIQNYNLSLSGGSERVNYTVSGDYFNQEGIIPGSLYERLTVRANSDYKVKSFL